MTRAFQLFVLVSLVTSGCSSARVSHDEIRKQIAEIGTSNLIPKSIEVRRVVSQSGNRAIAETTVELAFQFDRDTSSSPWRVSAIRMGSGDWLSLPELIAAVDEGRRRQTAAELQKLVAGIDAYRRQNGAGPTASDIVTLTDILHPRYMTDLVRLDAWGHPIQYEATGSNFKLRSYGADGRPGTPDDILLPE